MTLRGDTIAAIATAPGRGGVAIVRVSGPEAFKIAETLTGKKPTPGRITLAKIYGTTNYELRMTNEGRIARFGRGERPARPRSCGTHDPTKSPNSAIPHSSFLLPTSLLDEGLILAFAAPHSYTGEDVVEFQCHGGSVTPRRILAACFAAGARLAERGEFTARAFLNGRIGLGAAEGVIELVDAKTDRAADAALSRLAGERAKRHRALYDTALDISTTLEHALDVDESDLPDGFVEGLGSKVKGLRDEIAKTISKLREGKILRDGARVVLAGAPNAGKSSLLNALLGENRAIVSATPGTTRDSIEEWLDIEGWPVRLTDTAGLRGTDDAIEAEGVARANELIAKADLVLALDCDVPGAIRIHAKCDLDEITNDELRMTNGGRFASSKKEGANSAIRNSSFVIHHSLPVSARTGEGLDALRHAIAERLAAKAQQIDEPAGDSEREASLLAEALSFLKEFTVPPFLIPHSSFLTSPADPVLLANAVRSCAETLGRLVGAVYSDDLLDALFSRFCVGK